MKIVLPTNKFCFTHRFNAKTPFAQEFSISDREVYEMAGELSVVNEEDSDGFDEEQYERWLDFFSSLTMDSVPELCRNADEFRDMSYDIKVDRIIRKEIERESEYHVRNQTRW